jgi:hypothetical protein
MKLKQSSGWFAAGGGMLQAVELLSDGAFKLFVYVSLNADRSTGRLQMSHSQLARALSKSRRSIVTYLEELASTNVCKIRSASNQHSYGEIEIADHYWPYHKLEGSDALSCVSTDQHLNQTERQAMDAQANYIDQVKKLFLAYPIVHSSFTEADRKLAERLFREGVSLETMTRALLLGLSRKSISELNSNQQQPIRSLSYFIPLLEEVSQIQVSDQYWRYLRFKLDQWAAQFGRLTPGGSGSSQQASCSPASN